MARHVDASDYRDLYRRTRTLPAEMKKDFRRHLRDAAKIGADAAKVRARAISHGGTVSRWQTTRHRSLGSILAAGIRVSVKGDDVRIVQSAAGIGGRNAKGLPRGLDNFTGFTHPTFGHDPVVEQAGRPYFQRTMDEKRGEMEREVANVLDDIRRHLT